MSAPVIPIDAHEAANLASYHAERERIDGIFLRTHRQKIREALTIADVRRRDRELHKIAISIRGYAWCRALVDGAIELARLTEEFLRYGRADAKDNLRRATAAASQTLCAWAGKES